MWLRDQLKAKAKYALKQNYWKVVLVTLIVALIGGSAGIEFQNSFSTGFESGYESQVSDDSTNDQYSEQYEADTNSDEYFEGYWAGFKGDSLEASVTNQDYLDGYNDGSINGKEIADVRKELKEIFEDKENLVVFITVFIIVFLVIFIIAMIISLVFSAFLLNPIDVGTKRFFYKSLNEQAQVKEVAYAFDHSYRNVVKILFFRDLYTMLWSLLFIIPGIVKAYEYRMMPYLLAENPNLTKEQAFALSKQMMSGQKWRTFVLDLSFIGWHILSLFTLGILSVFYVEPYRNLTMSALYEELSLLNGRPAFSQQPNRTVYSEQNMNPYIYGQPSVNVQPEAVVEEEESNDYNSTEE